MSVVNMSGENQTFAKLYSQRGNRLFWLTKKELAETTKAGDRFNAEITEGKIVVKFTPDGSRKVYGKKTKNGMDPVISFGGKQVTEAFGAANDGTINNVKLVMNGKGFTLG